MYENQGIYSPSRIKGNLLGKFNSQKAKTKKYRIEACTKSKRMGMDGAF